MLDRGRLFYIGFIGRTDCPLMLLACILFSDLKDRKAASVRSIYRLYEEASGVGLVILQREHLHGPPLRKCFDKESLLSIRWGFTHETVAQL